MANLRKPTLVFADHHIMVVEGLTKLLEDEFEILDSAYDETSALKKTFLLNPDLVLLDITLPGSTGTVVARKLFQLLPHSKILILTQHTGLGYVREAFRAGVRGYLLKQSASSELRLALREVLKGNYYVTPLLTKGIPPSLIRPKNNPSNLFGKELTNRQREVLKWLAEGKAAKEIANLLNISQKTVEFHKCRIREVLGRRNSAELTRYAIESGIAQ